MSLKQLRLVPTAQSSQLPSALPLLAFRVPEDGTTASTPSRPPSLHSANVPLPVTYAPIRSHGSKGLLMNLGQTSRVDKIFTRVPKNTSLLKSALPVAEQPQNLKDRSGFRKCQAPSLLKLRSWIPGEQK